MWVFVTAQTSLKFEVGFPHMAFAAQRYGFLDFRWMSGMTACTPNILVFPSGCCNVSWRNIVTLQTVFVAQHSFCLGSFCLGNCCTGISQQPRDAND